MPLVKPAGYRNLLDNVENTEKAIKLVKDMFQQNLSAQLALLRVTAPMVVLSGTGINDDLNSVERPVSFPIRDMGERRAEVVHSLAKWKRLKLAEMAVAPGRGIYTDMNALRPDEELDNIHSLYVDQWDWEKVIAPRDRNLDYLKHTVEAIVCAMADTQKTLRSVFPQLSVLPQVHKAVSFVTTQELEDAFPHLTAKEREDAWVKDHPTTFLIGIGGALQSGKPHDGRAPDYDDWTLNGDILLWDDLLGRAIELSSMGIRVDAAALDRQLKTAGCDSRRELTFHKLLLEDKLPLTIGGGIGQSRLSMFLLGKAHIGEVQVSTWDDETIQTCHDAGIILL